MFPCIVLCLKFENLADDLGLPFSKDSSIMEIVFFPYQDYSSKSPVQLKLAIFCLIDR